MCTTENIVRESLRRDSPWPTGCVNLSHRHTACCSRESPPTTTVGYLCQLYESWVLLHSSSHRSGRSIRMCSSITGLTVSTTSLPHSVSNILSDQWHTSVSCGHIVHTVISVVTVIYSSLLKSFNVFESLGLPWCVRTVPAYSPNISSLYVAHLCLSCNILLDSILPSHSSSAYM